MRDLVSFLSPVSAIDPAVYSADNTPPAIDLRGFDSAMIALAVGVGGITFTGTNKIEFVLTHSDDGVTYTNVTDNDVVAPPGDAFKPGSITGGIIRALTAAHAAATVQRLGYVGGKRYLKLLADFSGTHGSGTPICALVERGNPSLAPAA